MDELKTDYWKVMIIQGAQITRCRSNDDFPKRIIQQILEKKFTGKVLLLQAEMADLKMELKETEAVQELYSQLDKLVEKQMVLLWRIDEERKVASEASMMVKLQTQYNDLQVQIDEKLCQMQELKLTWLKNLLRFFSRK